MKLLVNSNPEILREAFWCKIFSNGSWNLTAITPEYSLGTFWPLRSPTNVDVAVKFIEPSETSVCTVYTLTVHQKVQSRCWGVPVAIICVHIKTRVNKKMEEDPMQWLPTTSSPWFAWCPNCLTMALGMLFFVPQEWEFSGDLRSLFPH